MSKYSIINLHELEDMAQRYGHGDHMEARFATKPLELQESGLGLQFVKPNQEIPFKHKHKVQEEVFIVLKGSGSLLLDDETVEVTEMDAVRVPAEIVRTAKAGPDGMEILIVGAPNDGSNDAVMI